LGILFTFEVFYQDKKIYDKTALSEARVGVEIHGKIEFEARTP